MLSAATMIGNASLDAVGSIDGGSLVARIRTRVRDLIVAGRVAPDRWLRIADLAAQVGTSITPVRAALVGLEHEGLIEVAKARGFRIIPLTRADIADAYLVSGYLSGELSARAARTAGDELIASCAALQEEMERLAGGAPGDIDELNWRFHRIIHRYAGAPRLARALGVMLRTVPHDFHCLVPGWTGPAMEQHRALLGALRARDAEAARHVAQRHMRDGCELLIAQLERTGYWSMR